MTEITQQQKLELVQSLGGSLRGREFNDITAGNVFAEFNAGRLKYIHGRGWACYSYGDGRWLLDAEDEAAEEA